MKEENYALLWGLGMIAVIILATFFLKKFFNIPTSGALVCVIVVIGILCIIALFIIEYTAHRARKKQSRIEAKKLVQINLSNQRRGGNDYV